MVPTDWLEAQLGRMVGLRNMPDRSEAYHEALAGLGDDVVAAGIGRAIKTRTFFPAPAELLDDCQQAAPRDTWQAPVFEVRETATTAHIAHPGGGKGITVRIDREWKHYCTACGDTGWAPAPSRRVSVYNYDYVARCACWEGNPALHRKRESLAQAAVSRTKGKDRE
jgi:hypothetical protein